MAMPLGKAQQGSSAPPPPYEAAATECRDEGYPTPASAPADAPASGVAQQPQFITHRVEITGSTLTSLPLQLYGLGVDNVWQEVVAGAIAKYDGVKAELDAAKSNMRVTANPFKMLFKMGQMMEQAQSLQRLVNEKPNEFMSWLRNKCEEVNTRADLAGRVQFTSTSEQQQQQQAYVGGFGFDGHMHSHAASGAQYGMLTSCRHYVSVTIRK